MLLETSFSTLTGSEAAGTQRLAFYTDLDNLGEVISWYQFQGDGLVMTNDANADGVPDRPDALKLRQYKTFTFDQQGRDRIRGRESL